MTKPKVQLTPKEKSELFIEGVITVILLLLLNLSITILINSAIINHTNLSELLKDAILFRYNFDSLPVQIFLISFMVVLDIVVLYWRLLRRYRQMQMRHVISELHYIAQGHFDHRINFVVENDLQRMVDSINSLVDSTVTAMNEERAIKKRNEELITNVSHDIRTPLTSIIGYLGLLQTMNFNDENIKHYVDIAYIKSQQMKVLADDLFDYTTVHERQVNINPNNFVVDDMLNQLAASFELEAKEKGIKIEVEVSPSRLEMNADNEKLGRVFNNLISNALKYGKKATLIKLTAKAENGQVEMTVENNGQKIPKASLNRLFERFYRVESSRSTQTGGTGLGLAISKEIITLHHGQIFAQSNAKLTKFVIEMPQYFMEKN
ncbi:HAMP domain-containing sensor histidine kinase [Holzapfeliella sp. He02]|uniref:histidine kinase n=1 Tax=Holzapfeliella saturejae TaxID=3082953 RepID=A0ABU8SFS0_9LACO